MLAAKILFYILFFAAFLAFGFMSWISYLRFEKYKDTHEIIGFVLLGILSISFGIIVWSNLMRDLGLWDSM